MYPTPGRDLFEDIQHLHQSWEFFMGNFDPTEERETLKKNLGPYNIPVYWLVHRDPYDQRQCVYKSLPWMIRSFWGSHSLTITTFWGWLLGGKRSSSKLPRKKQAMHLGKGMATIPLIQGKWLVFSLNPMDEFWSSYTPWRFTWVIMVEVKGRSFSFLNGLFVGSMLIFQGVWFSTNLDFPEIRGLSLAQLPFGVRWKSKDVWNVDVYGFAGLKLHIQYST